MRRFAWALILMLALPLAPAEAQEQPEVRLALLDQETFVTPESPLRIQVGAINNGDTTFRNLTLTVSVHFAVRSRSEYGQALEAGSSSSQFAQTRPVKGPLAARAGRSFPAFEIEPGPQGLAAPSDNELLPVTVELRSTDLVTPIAVLHTWVVFIVQDPRAPLNVALAFVLDEPVRARPDGTLLDDRLERTLQPGGRLSTIVTSLHETPVPMTLVVSPVLLEQLQRMGQGYRVAEAEGLREVPPEDPTAARARTILERLRELARLPGTEVVPLPYASPSIPALVTAGLEHDLALQIERGRSAAATLLGVEPSSTVFRPPGSELSEAAVDVLQDRQVGALLVDADALSPPLGFTLTPPGAAELAAGGDQTMQAITPDPGVEARMAALPEDPRLRAQWVLGELSSIYFEQPSIDRGTAIVFGEEDAPEPRFLSQLLTGLREPLSSQWLRAEKATRVLIAEADAPPDLRDLQSSSRSPALSFAFTSELARARAAVTKLESMADQPQLIDQVRRQILLAESRYLQGPDDYGLAFLRSARQTVDREVGKVHLPAASSITLTSRGGVIPVTLRSGTGYPVQVQLELRSPRLEFVGGDSRPVTLTRPVQVFVFPVRAKTTGRFEVVVEVRTPSGASIGSSSIVVRSTAYNRVALIVTIGAALFLAGWWGRRFLPRRRG